MLKKRKNNCEELQNLLFLFFKHEYLICLQQITIHISPQNFIPLSISSI